MNTSKQIKDSWNEVYQLGTKYKGEQPVPFVKTILATLERNELTTGKGLYIGCGNGRNYIPLVEAGLDLVGLDISDVALKEISDLKPELTNKLTCLPFSEYRPTTLFDYVIAIQVFQHGNYEELQQNFKKVADILKPGGLFFLRNRSTDNPTNDEYNVVERTQNGGFTLKYLTGTKKGLEIHFLSEGELHELSEMGLEEVIKPYTVRKMHEPPKKGEVVHWEGVWKKK